MEAGFPEEAWDAAGEESDPATDDTREGLTVDATDEAAGPQGGSRNGAHVTSNPGPLATGDEVETVGVIHDSAVGGEEPGIGKRGVPDSGAGATASRTPTRRLANVAITLILVVSLVFVASDAIPPVWIDRFNEATGLSELVSKVIDSRTISPDNVGDIAAPPVSVLTVDTVDEDKSPTGNVSWGEVSERTDSRALDQAPGNGTVADAASSPSFFINFSPNSDLLESDAWHALDSAALLLHEQPDRIAAISHSADEPKEQGLSQSRITAVEKYLLAAGITRRQLWVEGHTLPGEMQEADTPGVVSTGTDGRFVFIIVGSKLPP